MLHDRTDDNIKPPLQNSNWIVPDMWSIKIWAYTKLFIYLNLEIKYNAKAIGTYRHHSTYKSDMWQHKKIGKKYTIKYKKQYKWLRCYEY